MKASCFFLIILVSGCIYDPPLKGKEIFIENQTNDFVYVLDSLPGKGGVSVYDTFSVDNKVYISAKPNYISKYNKWAYFFSERKYKSMKSNRETKIHFYFIVQKDLDKTWEELKDKKLYKIINIDIDEINEKPVNHIFYYTDSINITHEYNFK